ncbi:NADP-dependent oxidoreductase domain-containing protein [Mycena sp. CBHHK59/15]|nr:NADP-dependent oxidoreductase domain-containing protein [Mycena sp. CBHHK59/15]
MATQVTKLGGIASNHGLMMMTATMSNWTSAREEQCFESIKAGVDALPPGTKIFLNSGKTIELLSRFYAKYPEYADKTFLSVKGAVRDRLEPDSSMENLRKSVSNILRVSVHQETQPLRARKSHGELVVLVKEGHFAHIGLSECSAETLRKANAVYPVTAAEIEVSVWEYGEEQKKVIATAGELGITVVAYSPLGKGFLTGKTGDYRARLTRFQEANMAHNMAIVSQLLALAGKKGVTPAQLCIAWVACLGRHVMPLPGSSKATCTLENCAAEDIVLSAEEVADITAIVENAEVKGDRMFGGKELIHLWG